MNLLRTANRVAGRYLYSLATIPCHGVVWVCPDRVMNFTVNSEPYESSTILS
jgi:hypothetical protein